MVRTAKKTDPRTLPPQDRQMPISFQDLRGAPAIFVGYSLTRWREISSQMRFFIDASRLPVMITDNGAPTKWMLPNLPADRRTNEKPLS